MSNLSQFAGNSIPFGQVQYLIENRANPTIDGVEYLKSGVLKSISGYEGLAARYLDLAINVPPNNYILTGSNRFFSSMYFFDGTRYISIGFDQTTKYTSNLASGWSSTYQGYSNSARDACRVGINGTVITTTQGVYFSGTTGDLSFSNNFTNYSYYFCASNNAGNLVLMMQGLYPGVNEAILISTNGSANWQAIVPTTDVSYYGPLHRLGWSNVGNCFFVFTNVGSVYTTTNGINYILRGIPSGITGSTFENGSSVYGNNNYTANSATSTLCAVNFNSVSHIARTTNGTTWTATPCHTLMPEYFAGPILNATPKLRYFNNTYYAVFGGTTTSKNRSIFKSTDDGVTWTSIPSIIQPSRLFSNGAGYQTDLVNLNGNTISIVTAISGETNGYYSTMSSVDSATHIGVPYPDSSTSLGTSYVRIK